MLVAAASILTVSSQAEQVIMVAPHSGIKVVDTADLTPMGKPGDKGVFQNTSKATGITFNIEFLDVTTNSNIGFDDAANGATRRATLIAVFDYLNTVLDHNGSTLDVQVQVSETDGTGFLASAGTYFAGSNGFQGGSTLFRIENGTQQFPGTEEIFVTVDFGYTWNDGLDPVQSGEFDLFSTLLHEVTHGLGYLSLLASDGQSQFAPNTTFTRFDELFALPASPGTPSITGSPLEFRPSDAPLTGGLDSVVFTGTNAATSFGSNPPIATPTTFFPGSSMGHWQGPVGSFSAPSTQQGAVVAVMNASTPPNTERREFAPFEIATLEDLGYSVQTMTNAEGWDQY